MHRQSRWPRASRREFLAGALLGGVSLASGLGCGGSSSGPRKPYSTREPTKRLGVALLGLGQYSEQQLGPALKRTRHCALQGIVTGTPQKIEPWQKEYGIADAGVYDYASLPRIADNPAIDVVYVVTPTALHAKYAIMAAEAGKHVWCEKPMAMNVQECRSIIDACRAHNVTLSIGYRMQHEPNTRTVMQYARTKPYGAIRGVRAVAGYRSGGGGGWRMDPAMGGGALYDMGVYSINAIRYASGEEPVRVVRARQWAERPDLFRTVDENSEFELELPSGVIAQGKTSLSAGENVLRVEAERGWYELRPMQAYDGVKGMTSDGTKLDQHVDDQQARQMDDDALAILERRAPMAPGEEGLRDVRLIEAIIRAAKTQAAVDIRD
jgi:glucose-fructose oxidoreductase